MNELKIVCIEIKGKIYFSLSQNGTEIITDQKSVEQLLWNVEEKDDNYKEYVHKFVRIQYRWNGSVKLKVRENSPQTVLGQLIIKASNRVTLQDIYAKKAQIVSRNLYLDGTAQIQDLYFEHQKSQISDKLRKNIQNYDGKESLTRGKIKLLQNAQMKLNKLETINSDLIIYKNAEFKIFWTNGFLNLQNTELLIHPYGTLCVDTNLAIRAYSIENKGKIIVKNDNVTLVLIATKFRNIGHIKINSFAISSKRFVNEQVGKIQGKNGSINLNGEGVSQNKGNLFLNHFQLINTGPNNFFTNYKTITSNIIQGKVYSFQNKGEIICNNFELIGSNKNSFFDNDGSITPQQRLSLKDIHVINAIRGNIQCLGNVNFDINAWINEGNMNSNNDAQIISQGIIKNKGILSFNKNLKMKAQSFANQNQMRSKNTQLNIDEIFMNEGIIKIENGSIFADSLTNLKNMELVGSSIITSNIFTTKNDFGFGDEVTLKTKDIYFEGNIKTAKKTKIDSGYMNSRAKTEYDDLHIKIDYLRNEEEFNIKQKGNIDVKVGFSNSKSGKLDWNQVEFSNKNEILNIEEEAHFKKGKFNNVKDVYGATKIIFQDTKQQFRGVNVNNLGLRNAHIAAQTWSLKGQITAENGGMYEGTLPLIMEENQVLNKFVIQVRSPNFYKDLKIVLKGQDVQLKTVVASKYLNGMTLLQRPPVILGNFHHHLISERFQLPQDKYYYPVKKGETNKNKVYIPKNGQKSLTVQAKELQYRGNLVYEGSMLKFKTNKTDLPSSSIEVPTGILSLESTDSIKLVNTYLQAKGINLQSNNQISTQAVKFVAGLQGIMMQAKTIKDKPTITRNEVQSNGQGKSVRQYETAKQSQFLSEGNIIIKAEDYIHLVAPIIESKRTLWINSPNTIIHGIFLLDKTRTIVQKDTMWGGTKTNTYEQRNDKALPAQIKGQKIYLQGNAKINANMKANQLYDLTKNGVEMFFVVGYYGDFQNRQFCNFATQGVQGRNFLSEKLLKANLKEVAQIIRPLQLPGQMKFNTVEWDKTRTKITGHFKETVYKAKSWSTEWHHETITRGLLLTVGIAASFIGANVIGPYFTGGLQPLQVAMVKAGFSTLTNKLAVSLLGSGGDLSKAFQSFFSSDTLKALVFNVATAGITGSLTKALGITTVDINNNPIFTGIFKENLIKQVVNISLDTVINGNFPKNLQEIVTPFVVDVFGEYTAGKLGNMYLKKQIGYLVHKGIHGVIGAIGGFLLSKNVSGIVSGALAAVAAEVAMQAMVPIEALRQKSDALLQRMMNGEKITGNQIVESIQKEIAIGKIIGMTVGGLFGKNWDIAKNMATNAVDHNWVQIAAAIGHVALKALITYLCKKGYDAYVKPKLLQNLKISQKQKLACDQVIDMVKDGFDIWKGFSAWIKILKNPKTDSKGAFIQQIQNFGKINPLTLGTKIAKFGLAFSKFQLNPRTIGYLCAGFVEAGLFNQVDKLIGVWKSFPNMNVEKAKNILVNGIELTGKDNFNTNLNKKYEPKIKDGPISLGKSSYQMEQNWLNFGVKTNMNFNDMNNHVIRPQDLQTYDKIANLKVK